MLKVIKMNNGSNSRESAKTRELAEVTGNILILDFFIFILMKPLDPTGKINVWTAA